MYVLLLLNVMQFIHGCTRLTHPKKEEQVPDAHTSSTHLHKDHSNWHSRLGVKNQLSVYPPSKTHTQKQ